MSSAIRYVSDREWAIRAPVSSRGRRRRLITVIPMWLIGALIARHLIDVLAGQSLPGVAELAGAGSVAVTLFILGGWVMIFTPWIRSDNEHLTESSKARLLALIKVLDAAATGTYESDEKLLDDAELGLGSLARGILLRDRNNLDRFAAEQIPIAAVATASLDARSAKLIADGTRDFDAAVTALTERVSAR